MATVAQHHLEIRHNRAGEPRVYVVGTRLRVQDIAAEHEFGGLSAEQLAREFPGLSLGQVHAALSYFYDHRDEILAEMRSDSAFAESVRMQFPKPFPVATALR